MEVSKNSFNRVGISEGEFVELKMTSKGSYHGYRVSWNKLNPNNKAALIKTRMVTPKGKIL